MWYSLASQKGSSLLKNSNVELIDEEKLRLSHSYAAQSHQFGSRTWYFAFFKTHRFTFSTGCPVIVTGKTSAFV
jgi:hypothetical protein